MNTNNNPSAPPSNEQPPKGFLERFIPGLFALFHYDFAWLKGDTAAGLSVAAVALPVGIAYADLAGVPPVYGIYSAIFPLFAYALFGSSKQLITGPDAATCIIVASSLGPLAGGDPERYQALVVMLTLCTGLVYVGAGIIRLGFIANFLSLPILTGFLNGISLLIIIGQLQKLFGFHVEAAGFVDQMLVFIENIGQTHSVTAALGCGLLILLFTLARFLPTLPNPLFIVIFGIILVEILGLDQKGVALLGHVPAGLPNMIKFPTLSFNDYTTLFRDAAALTLISFTSGILTAKSFAQKNKYEIDANQELIGFGSCNIASGLVQGFPVTGADSRTAVCSAMGGKSQMVGVISGLTMLMTLFFLTGPMASLPIAALAAVIIVSAAGLFDFSTLRELYTIHRGEFIMSVITTIGVLIAGALPGVMIAVVLSLMLLLAINSKPPHAILGWVASLKGYHNIEDYPKAKRIPGLLIFRFEANIVFFNVDHFRQALKQRIAECPDEIKWVVIDASSINIVDVTGATKFRELREELKQSGILLQTAHLKQTVQRFFTPAWLERNADAAKMHDFSKLRFAKKAFLREYPGIVSKGWKPESGNPPEAAATEKNRE